MVVTETCARILDTFGPIVGESYGCGFLGVALLQSAHGNSPYAVVQLYSDHLLGHAFEAIWGLDKALQKIESCESMIEVPQYYFPLLMTANVYHLETIAIRPSNSRRRYASLRLHLASKLLLSAVPHHHRAHPRCHCRCCYRAHQRELLCHSSAIDAQCYRACI